MDTRQINAKAVFDHALEIESADARKAYMDEACADDPAVREKVEALLRAYEAAGSFLESGPAGLDRTLEQPQITEGPGSLIGPYKLLQQIGEGAFGVVYMAQQREPVRRKVALKIIKPGMDTQQVVARFEAERQALAMMEHPNIARVLDAGATDSGRPYFVMELVKGVPITEYCDKNELPARQRLDLFVTVCQAVQHAHQKGVIHRDLKPTNIMVTLHDGQAVPKVIDFGVSKAINQQLTEKTLFTAYGQMVGTPQYMSPEQAEMSGLDVDTRSDVYSLGVLLYELLTGATPLESERLHAAGYAEMQRIICEEEPPKPSVRLSSADEQQLTVIAKHRSADPRQLRQLIRGELDWIVMRSLEKERSRRYETPTSLAADVERFLHDEPVEACPPSTIYRLRKFVRRNKLAVSASSLVTMCVLLLVSVFAIQQVRIIRERERRKQEAFDAALTDMDKAAGDFEREGDWGKAQGLLEKLVGILIRVDDPDVRRTLETKYRLANAIREQNGLEDALPLYEEVLSELERLLGSQEATVRKKKAQLSKQCARSAWEILAAPAAPERHVVALAEKGVKYRETPWTLWVLALGRYRTNDYKGALDALKGAGLFDLAEFESWKLFEPDHPRQWLLLGLVNWRLGDADTATDWYVATYRWVEDCPPNPASVSVPLLDAESIRLFNSPATWPLPEWTGKDAVMQAHNRLISKNPRVPSLYFHRGLCRARLQQWEEAEDDFRRAARLAPNNFYYQQTLAYVLLYNRKDAEYNEFCRDHFRKFSTTQDANTLADLVRACAVGVPKSVDLQQLRAAADTTYSKGTHMDSRLAKGMVAYRCGEFQEVIETLEGLPVLRGYQKLPISLAFQAMAHQELGNSDLARELLEKARTEMKRLVPGIDGPGLGYLSPRPLVWCRNQGVLHEAESLIERTDHAHEVQE